MRAGWMRPSCEQLLERHAGDLAPHAVEAREDHGVRGVVDDEVDAGEVLERADVAPLTADDAALHVVGGELDDRHGRLGRVAGGHALHDDGEDVAHAALGVALGLLLDRAHAARAVVARLRPRARAAGSTWPARRSGPRRARARARAARAPTAISARWLSNSSSRRSSVERCPSSAASLASRRSSRRTISPRRSLRSASMLPPAIGSAATDGAVPARRGPASAGARRASSDARPPAPRPDPAPPPPLRSRFPLSFPLPFGPAEADPGSHSFGSARPGSRHRAERTCMKAASRPPRQMAASSVLVGGNGRDTSASESMFGRPSRDAA